VIKINDYSLIYFGRVVTQGFTGMANLLSFIDSYKCRELLGVILGDSIGCTPYTFTERMIMDVIASVMLSYWRSCAFVLADRFKTYGGEISD